jgi:hypothetical protein
VTDRFAGERRDLSTQNWEVLPGQVTGRGGSGLANDPGTEADHRGRCEGIGGNVDEVVAFLFGQKVFYAVNRRIAMNQLEARMEEIHAVEDGDGSRLLLLLLMLMLMLLILFLRAVLVLRMLVVSLSWLWRNHGGNW